MPSLHLRLLILLSTTAVLTACTRDAGQVADPLLRHVPADTPYVMVTGRPLPEVLRRKLGDHYAAQLAGQRGAFERLRGDMLARAEGSPGLAALDRLFGLLDVLLVEFEGRDTVAQWQELGIEPVSRSVFYGIGPLPAARVEIQDAAKFAALLDRVEQRAGMQAGRGESAGQVYRRIDLGAVDLVLAVTERYVVAGMLADALFERDLPLLLGQRLPATSLAESGIIANLIERHGFTGYGEGFVRLDHLLAALVGKSSGRSAEVMQALGDGLALPAPPACLRLTEYLVGGMPRLVLGVTRADEHHLVLRSVWESRPEVAAYLQRLAAPVPGLGGAYDGLLAFGVGIELPQLRNAIDALLRTLLEEGAGCDWIDEQKIAAVVPRLNLALGPMTAGIKGFNLQLADFAIDPATMRPIDVRAGLIAAVDDPRGMFALGAMFSPALAKLDVPHDGSLVDLPRDPRLRDAPPLKVAIKDRALLLLAGREAADLAPSLLGAVPLTPAPLFAVDYGVFQLVQRIGDVTEGSLAVLEARGEQALVGQLREQLAAMRQQAELFDRVRVSVHASAAGLVVEQGLQLR